jgi:hypothetical protein
MFSPLMLVFESSELPEIKHKWSPGYVGWNHSESGGTFTIPPVPAGRYLLLA